MINNIKSHFFILAFFVLTNSVNGQEIIHETDLSDAINVHQNATVVSEFSIQQATNKAHILSVKISPNGQYIAYTTQESKGISIHLMNIESKKSSKLFNSHILESIDWSTDGKLLFLRGANYLAYVDPFLERANPQIFYRYNSNNEESFYGVDTSQPQQVLISRKVLSKKESNPHHILRLDTQGNETLLYADKIKIYDYLFDKSGQFSFIRQPNTITQKHVIYQIKGKQKKPVFSCVVIDKCRMIKFVASDQKLFMIGFGEYAFRSFYSVNINTKVTELIHQDPEQIADLINIVVDEKSGEVLQLDYHSDRLKHYALNEPYNNHFKNIESSLEGRLNIESSQLSDNWLITQRSSLLQHKKYHLYNKMSQQLEPILQQVRNQGEPLLPDKLVSNIPITYKASDGMVLYGYIMLPKGKLLSEVPLLTSVHGGPFNRNRGGFSSTQYLVNQGFAIFQPNFRASTGYGMKYMLAGKEKFSTRVQQDILDGIDFIVNQGIGDKAKLGVFGHSFGGYSVLALMSQYPDVFVAGVATAPGTDLLKLLKTMDHKGINEYDGLALKVALKVLFADIKNKKVVTKMKRTSPVTTIDGINKPLLMWGGRQDQRIPITHLRDFALKLKQAGKSIEFFEDKKVGHNPPRNDEKTPQAMLYMITEFFNRHIQKTSTESNDDINSYMKRYRVY